MSLTSCRRLLSTLPTRLSTPSFSSKCVTPSLQRAYQSTSSSRTKLVATTDLNETGDILETVSRNIDNPDADKFAVVSVKSRQFKVSINDVIQVDNLDLDPGTEITLDKVLLVGSLNYTLVGRPLLPTSTVTVRAMVIERGRGPYLRVYNSGKHHTRTFFWGKTWHKMHFHESMTTMLRIMGIEVSNTDLREGEAYYSHENSVTVYRAIVPSSKFPLRLLTRSMSPNISHYKYWDKIVKPSTQFICNVFKKKGFDVRVVGGAVRDVLQNKPPTDIDMTTTAKPDQIVSVCTDEGIKHILTGLQHGTVTLMVDNTPFEVTTLRVDTDTDGRHAEVEFTTDFKLDAARRDLTINAMSVDVDGTLYDYFNGVVHLENKEVLFVGDPVERIAEDYLRILRYFRFYGRIAEEGSEWDGATIAAIDKNKAGLQQISRERIWLEMQKIIVGNHVEEILTKMKSLNLFPLINLSDDFSIDNLCSQHKIALVKEIRSVTLLSYAFKSGDGFSKLRKAWKMSMDEEYIGQFIIKHRKESELKYFQDLLVDTPKHCRHKFHMGFKELCLSRGSADSDLLKTLTEWTVPEYPLRGDQVIKHLSLPRGPLVYKFVTLGKNKWKESYFSLSGDEILAFLTEEYNKTKR